MRAQVGDALGVDASVQDIAGPPPPLSPELEPEEPPPLWEASEVTGLVFGIIAVFALLAAICFMENTLCAPKHHAAPAADVEKAREIELPVHTAQPVEAPIPQQHMQQPAPAGAANRNQCVPASPTPPMPTHPLPSRPPCPTITMRLSGVHTQWSTCMCTAWPTGWRLACGAALLAARESLFFCRPPG